MNPRFRKFYEKYYGQMVGKTVQTVGIHEDGVPYIAFTDGTVVEVLRDEEGNGPGFIAGLPAVKPTA